MHPQPETQQDDLGPILASLDIFKPQGLAEGWAMYRDSSVPCHVQVRLDGAVVGEDIADKFRPDLLRAGLGYGYCAFSAKLQPLPAGEHAFTLHDARSGAAIKHRGPAVHAVPPFAIEAEDIGARLAGLRQRRWRDQDLLDFPDGLRLGAQYEHLGAERYVDRVFQFALGRWVDKGALAYVEKLRQGEMTPEAVFLAVLNSGERQQQTRPLPSPLDPDFPFLPAPPALPAGDGTAAAAS